MLMLTGAGSLRDAWLPPHRREADLLSRTRVPRARVPRVPRVPRARVPRVLRVLRLRQRSRSTEGSAEKYLIPDWSQTLIIIMLLVVVIIVAAGCCFMYCLRCKT